MNGDPAAVQQREIGVGVVVELRHRSCADLDGWSDASGVGVSIQAITRMRARRASRVGGEERRMATRPGAHRLLDAVRAQQLLEGDELVGMLDDLERHAAGPDVDDARAEDVGERDELGAAVGRRRDLDEQQLALDRVVAAQLVDLEHVDQLVQLLDDLVDRGLRAVDADRDARAVLALGRARPRGSRC